MMFNWKKENMPFDAKCDAAFFINPEHVEAGTIEQIHRVMQLPFAKHLAVLPDTHLGYGMPIGGVLATDSAIIIPNAVGVDIGCGMCAMRTNIFADALSKDQLRDLVRMIKERIPVGFKKHNHSCLAGKMPAITAGPISAGADEWNNATHQLGTLGGGNHFIEIQAGSDGFLWVMVHSGSRHLGKTVCDYYNKIAKDQNDRNFSQVPSKWDLAFLHRKDKVYHNYLRDMHYCIEYAHLNRAEMMNVISDIIAEHFNHDLEIRTMDICHNHAQLEHHFGHNYMVHRKGVAGPYRVDTMGVIPGSMGTSSYIVVYKDSASPLAMLSTTHGAGRAMSRTAAKKNLDLHKEHAKLSGVLHDMTTANDLDEAPGSYKDINTVMKNQSELCDVVVELKPLASVKG